MTSPKFRKNQKNVTVGYNTGKVPAIKLPIATVLRMIGEGKINWMRHADGQQSFWRAAKFEVSFADFKKDAQA